MGNICCPPHREIDPAKLDFRMYMDEEMYDEMVSGLKKERSEKITLMFECKGLTLKGDFDPIIFLFRCTDDTFSDPVEEFKTEAIADIANP